MIYVALLRGINVGGKNKIDMKPLKASFEKAGMNSIVTYINTGNIIFSNSVHSKTEIQSILEQAILNSFGLPIKVVVLSYDEFEAIMHSLPGNWTNDQQMKSDVLFLWEDINDDSIIDKMVIKPEIDTVKYVPGAVLWSVDRKNVTKSGFSKLIGTKIYKQMTIRNVNTTRKIFELMEAEARTQV